MHPINMLECCWTECLLLFTSVAAVCAHWLIALLHVLQLTNAQLDTLAAFYEETFVGGTGARVLMHCSAAGDCLSECPSRFTDWPDYTVTCACKLWCSC